MLLLMETVTPILSTAPEHNQNNSYILYQQIMGGSIDFQNSLK